MKVYISRSENPFLVSNFAKNFDFFLNNGKNSLFFGKKLDSLQNTIELEMLKLHESHVEANVLEDFSHYSYEGLNFEKF